MKADIKYGRFLFHLYIWIPIKSRQNSDSHVDIKKKTLINILIKSNKVNERNAKILK